MTNRVCLIIDAGFFAATQKQIGNIDLLKLKQHVQRVHGPITRAYYVTSYITDEIKGYHNYIKSVCKFEIIIKGQKEKHCQKCGNISMVEKGIDIAISTLAVKHSNKYDILVVWNGDGDLFDSWQYLRNDLDKEIIVYGELNNVSPDIQSITDLVIVSDIYKEIAK